MKRTIGRAAMILSVGGLLAGCLVGPDYHRPAVPVPAAYVERADWVRAAPADAAPKGDWWTGFEDPLLDQLEPRVAVSNQTVRENYATYRQALAEVRVARSELFPTLGLSATATRAQTAGGIAGPARSAVNSGAVEGTASWTPDLWGSVRRLIEENSAIAQADEATLANATLSEQALLATTVIELRYADAAIDLERQTVAAYRRTLEITERQGGVGLSATPPSAVITAQVALETAEANLTGLGVARAQYAHAIGVLVGTNPEDLPIPPSTTMPVAPAVPVGVPSTLLQRRPDIAAAERSMAAENAAVGIAVAAYYPTVPLSAAAGFSQSPLSGLLHAGNEVWSVGATATETLLDFGGRRGAVEAAKAAYAASVASYRQTVLNAFQAVENDLAAVRILAAESEQLGVAVRDAKRGTEIALAEFQAGTVDYTTVAAAQEVQLNDQQNQLSVQESLLLDTVSLIADLGGGWSSSELHDPAHPAAAPFAAQ